MIKDAEFGRSTEVADVSWITPVAVADWPTRKKTGPDSLHGRTDIVFWCPDQDPAKRICLAGDVFQPEKRVVTSFPYSE